MLINGKERKFRYTVGAELKISEILCPDKGFCDFKSLIYEKDTKKSFQNHFMMALILNQQYEQSRHLSDPSYVPMEDITIEEVMNLSIDEMDQLQVEIYDAISAGSRQAVLIEEDHSKKKVKKSH